MTKEELEQKRVEISDEVDRLTIELMQIEEEIAKLNG